MVESIIMRPSNLSIIFQDKKNSDFVVTSAKLGSGGFSCIFLGYNTKTNELLAVKVVSPNRI